MRADHDDRLAALQALCNLALLSRAAKAIELENGNFKLPKALAKRGIMLRAKQRRRHEKQHRMTAADAGKNRIHRNLGLSKAHVAAK